MYVAWRKPFDLLVRLKERVEDDDTCNLMLSVCYSISSSFGSGHGRRLASLISSYCPLGSSCSESMQV
jgi:hypothetical protein